MADMGIGEIIALVAAIGSGVAGTAMGIASLTSKPKAPDAASNPLPDPNKAQAVAADTVKRQRQMLLATGGQTDYTGGAASVTGADLMKSTLLGA